LAYTQAYIGTARNVLYYLSLTWPRMFVKWVS